MSYLAEYKQKFEDLRSLIKTKDRLRRDANGGNSILFTYPPLEEYLYIEKAKELYVDKAVFIDVSKLFTKFIDEDGWESFRDYYDEFKDTPNTVFRSDNDPATDLYDLIINEIEPAARIEKIPFLVRTGCLYGTGISNINIMEHQIVMNLPLPLVIFYPSRIEDDNLYFLNFKSASRYRCALVE